MTLVADSGPAFRNRFEEECAKLGVRIVVPSSQSAVKRSVGSLKHLLKRIVNMNQLQWSEMVLARASALQSVAVQAVDWQQR